MARPARLGGWRRVWVQTALRPAAYLSVRPAPGDAIAGLTAAVPGGDWAALDLREAAYARHAVTADTDTGPEAAQVYAVASPTTGGARHPILLSYLDCVVQGFLREYGPAGIEAFFATTDGWVAGITDDRAAPHYPRAQVLTMAERALVDLWLSRLPGT